MSLKPDGIKIVSIIFEPGVGVLGLGSDEKLYLYAKKDHNWVDYATP